MRRGGRAARLSPAATASCLPVRRCRVASLPALCRAGRGHRGARLCCRRRRVLARLAARAGAGAAAARRGRQQRRDGYRRGARLDEAAARARRICGRALAWPGRRRLARLAGRGAGGHPATPTPRLFTAGRQSNSLYDSGAHACRTCHRPPNAPRPPTSYQGRAWQRRPHGPRAAAAAARPARRSRACPGRRRAGRALVARRAGAAPSTAGPAA